MNNENSYRKAKGMNADNVDQLPDISKLKYRIMYIEEKFNSLEGNARIGKVYFSRTGKTLYYRQLRLQSLKGSGYKANYFDVDTGNQYWISGPRKDRNDRLYGGCDGVEIDEDARDEYFALIQQ